MKINELKPEEIKLGTRIRSCSFSRFPGVIYKKIKIESLLPYFIHVVKWADFNRPDGFFIDNQTECEIIE